MQRDLQDSRPLPSTNNNANRKVITKKVVPNPLNPKVLEAVKAREEELKNDPHARHIDAHNVQCLLCDRIIKLSSKSLFDLSHWKEHRSRKHGIRIGNVKKPHTTRILVEETNERVKSRKPSSTPSDHNKKSVQNQLITAQLHKYPSPSGSDTSSQSSGDAPRRSTRSHKSSHRFNPLAPVLNDASHSSSRRRSLRHHSSAQGCSQIEVTPPSARRSRSDRAESSPLSSVPRSFASSTSSLTSLSSSDISPSSIGEDPVNPLPVLPELTLPSEIMEYLSFARCPPQIYRTTSATDPVRSFPCWRDWSWSMLNLPRWSTCEDEDEEGEHKPHRPLSSPRGDTKSAAVPECTMDEGDPHLRSTGVGYMFFDHDASSSPLEYF
ncbi:hypothetical protein E1B28_007307 [Marasmius oreades]|uniref:Uncharacterized protein n=1 Tax=Marasmius oreades TaxID=181124 RepID=A0A9P7S1L7_9AGAR|nr:uncharacterized protein E1B28_007307 [Marasmius oreades]KAG7093645.1 hypothetical protein E1B28_007307 [Marasmius oreades]